LVALGAAAQAAPLVATVVQGAMVLLVVAEVEVEAWDHQIPQVHQVDEVVQVL
jgi:hypothetical protein